VERKVTSGIMIILLSIGILTLAFNIEPIEASGTIYIRANGSIDPPIAPISSVDNITYTFTDNIYDEIVVERNNIIIDGDGYTLQGSGSGYGFYSYEIDNVTIQKTDIRGFTFGIFILESSFTNISGNNATNNGICGVSLYNSKGSIISGNNITNNPYGFALGGGSSHHNRLSGNNIANNGRGIVIDGCSNNSISENNITANSDYGLKGVGSNNSISENNITANECGISLELYSNNNSIYRNNIANSIWGIRLQFGPTYNRISGNNITNNAAGILLTSSSNNSISGNNITNNAAGSGIGLYSSSSNIVFGNNITNNYWGVRIEESSNNKVYQNNFIGNTQQVYFYTSGYANFWDDGYPSGGNYWSDYTDIDVFSGPYQNVTGSDGIGDIPYTIDENNQDRYPLIYPWSPLLGDINGDRKVDGRDIAIVAKAFASYPTHPRWNPRADLNQDNKIDGRDIAIVAKNFGKTYP